MTFWLGAFGVFIAPVLLIARFARPARCRTGVAIATGLAATLVGLIGLLALLFNGYVEDNGSQPAGTLGLAAALLSESAVLYLLAWSVAARRRVRSLAVVAGAGAVFCAVILSSGS